MRFIDKIAGVLANPDPPVNDMALVALVALAGGAVLGCGCTVIAMWYL